MNKRFIVPVAASVILVCALIAIGAFFVAGSAEKSREDSGIAACKEIVENSKKPASGSKEKMTKEQRTEKLKPWAESKHADLMAAGTSLVEAVYKVDHLDLDSKTADTPEEVGEQLGNAVGAQILIKTQYGILKNACANHGVEIPSLDA